MPSTRKMDPEKMRKILEYVDGFWETSKRKPTNVEIGGYVGISKAMVTYYLTYMAKEGLIEYTGREIITPRMKKEMGLVEMRVAGSVSCGAPAAEEEADPEDAEMARLPRSMIGDGSFYILKANGESMAGAGINNGDYVVIRRQDDAGDGDIAVFRLSDGTNTLKRYHKDADHGILSPENPDRETYKTYHERGFEIRGVAVMAMKKL